MENPAKLAEELPGKFRFAKHNIDLQFSHYCCYVNHVDPAKGVVFMNYDRFYRGSLTGIESLP